MARRTLTDNITEEIQIPDKFSAEILDKKIVIKSDKGESSRLFRAENVIFKKDGSKLVIIAWPVCRSVNALVKTIAAHIRNMLNGLEKGYEYKLMMVYSHFPMTINIKGKNIEINNFTGEKKARVAKIVGNANVSVKGKEITVSGYGIEDVGQTAANIENATRITNKDRRIFQDGIFLVSKGLKSA